MHTNTNEGGFVVEEDKWKKSAEKYEKHKELRNEGEEKTKWWKMFTLEPMLSYHVNDRVTKKEMMGLLRRQSVVWKMMFLLKGGRITLIMSFFFFLKKKF
jgi:hypothetical protein